LQEGHSKKRARWKRRESQKQEASNRDRPFESSKEGQESTQEKKILTHAEAKVKTRNSVRIVRRPRPGTRHYRFVLLRPLDDAEFDSLDDWMAACPPGEVQQTPDPSLRQQSCSN